MSPHKPQPVALFLPWSTIFRVLGVLAALVILRELAAFLLLLAVAILVAVTLRPVVDRLKSRGLPEWAAMTITAGGFAVTASFLGFLILPAVYTQISQLVESFPQLQAKVMAAMPSPALEKSVANFVRDPTVLLAEASKHLVEYGGLALSGVSTLLVLVITSFYLLADGKRAYLWVRTFFPEPIQRKIDETAVEGQRVIFAYVIGQAITSLMIGIFAFALLRILHVPAALMIAAVAAVLDVIPVVGVMIAILLAALIALTVSASTALYVTAAFAAYQAFENYVIGPKIYGKRMELPTLVVMLSLTVGGLLGGSVGVLLALPLAALYPAIERIWLQKHLGAEVIADHQALKETNE